MTQRRFPQGGYKTAWVPYRIPVARPLSPCCATTTSPIRLKLGLAGAYCPQCSRRYRAHTKSGGEGIMVQYVAVDGL